MAGRAMEVPISRHQPLVRGITRWTAICLLLVLVTYLVVAQAGFHPDSYSSGILTLSGFLLATLYSLRKRSLRTSARLLRVTERMPNLLAARMISLDRLETWRFVHVAIGIMFLLPLSWHIEAGLRAGAVEIALGALAALVILSGIVGALIQTFLPHAMQLEPDHQVRSRDVEEALGKLHQRAEEAILGHSEKLVTAYLEAIRPVLRGAQPQLTLMQATLTGTDPSTVKCLQLRRRASELGTEAELYAALVDIAAEKIRLEQNRFNLMIGVFWLRFHVTLVILTAFVIIFHVLGILYLEGL